MSSTPPISRAQHAEAILRVAQEDVADADFTPDFAPEVTSPETLKIAVEAAKQIHASR